jgi:hypothetical protein
MIAGSELICKGSLQENKDVVPVALRSFTDSVASFVKQNGGSI